MIHKILDFNLICFLNLFVLRQKKQPNEKQAGSIILIYLGIALLTEMISFDYDKFLDQDGFYTLIYATIALGVFILILSFLGCCGAIKSSPWMLGVFGSIMTLIVVTQIVLCVLLFLYHKEVENISYRNTKEITQRIVKHYNAANSSEPFTRIVDNIQKYMRCCGVNGTIDWPYGKVPYSCCENNNTQIHWNRPLQEQYRVTGMYYIHLNFIQSVIHNED